MDLSLKRYDDIIEDVSVNQSDYDEANATVEDNSDVEDSTDVLQNETNMYITASEAMELYGVDYYEEFEFDDEYNIVGFILPNFCQMIHRQYPPNTIFQYSHTIFDENRATVVIQVNNQPIKVRIDLSELDK